MGSYVETQSYKRASLGQGDTLWGAMAAAKIQGPDKQIVDQALASSLASGSAWLNHHRREDLRASLKINIKVFV